MTDKAAITPTEVARTDNVEGLSYLDSLPRRLVTLYLPLALIMAVAIADPSPRKPPPMAR